MERRSKRNVVSLVSSVIVVIRLPPDVIIIVIFLPQVVKIPGVKN